MTVVKMLRIKHQPEHQGMKIIEVDEKYLKLWVGSRTGIFLYKDNVQEIYDYLGAWLEKQEGEKIP